MKIIRTLFKSKIRIVELVKVPYGINLELF